MTATAPIVEASGLTKVFRDFWRRPRVRAVDSIAFEIRRGEIFGLLGPNGSGKSTTIKMILGLLHKTSGRLSVFGRAPDDVAVKKHIGFLPEESYLYRFLDARETLDYYGKLFGLEASVRKRRTDELLQMVGLERVAHRPIGEYSKGMMRRIGIAQALVNDPEFLILDEPTSGLDPLGTRQVKDLLLDLKARGKTILLSSHLLADVEDVCDRMVILYGGKVRAEGTSEELLQDSGRSVIETDRLDPEAAAAVQSVLAERGLGDASVAARGKAWNTSSSTSWLVHNPKRPPLMVHEQVLVLRLSFVKNPPETMWCNRSWKPPPLQKRPKSWWTSPPTTRKPLRPRTV